MKYILVLLSMVFCHIVDDYYLQTVNYTNRQETAL